MRVLVTGHLGYIGGHLVPQLRQLGHEVLGCDTSYFAACLYQPQRADVPALNKDIRDLVLEDLQGVDAIIHLAGLSNDPLGSFRPQLTVDINQAAAVALAKRAQKAGVKRFLFASSCSNYGASTGELLDESAEFNPQTPYGHSKVNAETEICAMASEEFVSINLRAGTVYGVAPRIRFDLVVNNLTAHALANGEVLLKSDGAAWRPLVHVSDVARAYVACLLAPADLVRGEAFNVGRSAENYQIIEVAKQIERAIPNCRLRFEDTAAMDTRNYRVSCTKLEQTICGYQPQWTLEQGIDELREALLADPVSVAEFEGEKFNRLLHLRGLIERRRLDSQLRWI